MESEENVIDIPLCIKCAHYAYWDGDDTCVPDMKLLPTFPVSCRKFKPIECEKLLKLKIDMYINRLRKN